LCEDVKVIIQLALSVKMQKKHRQNDPKKENEVIKYHTRQLNADSLI